MVALLILPTCVSVMVYWRQVLGTTTFLMSNCILSSLAMVMAQSDASAGIAMPQAASRLRIRSVGFMDAFFLMLSLWQGAAGPLVSAMSTCPEMVCDCARH